MSVDPKEETALLRAMEAIPYVKRLGIQFRLEEERFLGELPFVETIIGNPMRRALHGGVSSAFLEITALGALVYETRDRYGYETLKLPRPITITVDYLRAGRPETAFASARVKRAGRRFASVDVWAWQSEPERPFVSATCHFSMPPVPE